MEVDQRVGPERLRDGLDVPTTATTASAQANPGARSWSDGA